MGAVVTTFLVGVCSLSLGAGCGARILVTGASGFVGRALVAELANGHPVRAVMRQPADVFPRSVEVIASWIDARRSNVARAA